MKLRNNIKTLAVVAGLALAAGSANAAITVTFNTEDMEDSDLGVWENATNQYRSNGLGAGNVLFDQTGTQASPADPTNFSGKAIRIRSSTGSLVLKDDLQLATLGATSVTLTYDIREHTASYLGVVQYSSDGQFQFDGDGDDTVTLASYDGNGTIDGLGVETPAAWRRYSHTITTGLTDTFQFRLGKPGGGSGSNPTYHAYDNLTITYDIVPEPSTTALLGLGGLALILRRRK